jgi:hypothetical protein
MSLELEITVKDYSDKSFCIFGDSTREYVNVWKHHGGRFNKNLKDIGPGWIFSKTRKEEIEQIIQKLKESTYIIEARFIYNM